MDLIGQLLQTIIEKFVINIKGWAELSFHISEA